MARKIQFKRGPKSRLTTLSPAEMAFTDDEKKLYVGDGTENIRLLDQKDKSEITSQLAEMGNIKGTTQNVTLNSRKLPEKIQHVDKQGTILREDSFVYSGKSITETRTLNTGYSVTYKHDLKTLQTEVI